MNHDAVIAAALREHLGLDVAGVRKLAGGDINDAFRAELTGGGAVFVKTSDTALAGMFTDEAAGLIWLGEPDSGIVTPRVIGVIDDEPSPAPRLLALEWIDTGGLDATGEERLGRGLATIHAAGAPAFGATPLLNTNGGPMLNKTGEPPPGRYGHSPLRFNELALPNDPCDDWAEFYAERRIAPLTRACCDHAKLSSKDAAVMQRLCERLPELAGPPEPPARIHGDLWAGNVIANTAGSPVLIDPVAHGGHRELDLALLQVFGGPGERCFAAYREAWPLAEGWQERKRLWQLAMILLHVYLFGGDYRAQALAIARDYI